MCDICKSEGLDTTLLNGEGRRLSQAKLYSLFSDGVVYLTLCPIHDAELFMVGENRFVKEHLAMLRAIITNRKNYVQKSY